MSILLADREVEIMVSEEDECIEIYRVFWVRHLWSEPPPATPCPWRLWRASEQGAARHR
jgi:hypothetical protein